MEIFGVVFSDIWDTTRQYILTTRQYILTTRQLHRSVCCLAKCRPTEISTFGTPLPSRIRMLQMYSHNDIPYMDLYIAVCVTNSVCSFFFMIAHVSLEYNIKYNPKLLKRVARKDFSSFALSTTFIVVNDFNPNVIRYKISASISR